MATIRIKAIFFYISLIFAHATTAYKNDGVKDAFYARLEATYDCCPTDDVKILLGDFNSSIELECIFHPNIDRFSLHETSTSNKHEIKLIIL